MLPRCQWLAITCPLTPETRGLVDSDKLGSLPRGAHVINVARGEIVNEVALIEALNSGHLAGAYLDVFEKEPLQPESPLWDMPGVILSPHNSAASSSNAQKVFELFLDNFGNWLRGEALRHEVKT